jgi:hypothetical protein
MQNELCLVTSVFELPLFDSLSLVCISIIREVNSKSSQSFMAKGDNSCSCVGFIWCRNMYIRLYKLILTQFIKHVRPFNSNMLILY